MHAGAAGPGVQTAGERARKLVWPILQLVERCTDALANDCEAAEAIANGQPIEHATLQVLGNKCAL